MGHSKVKDWAKALSPQRICDLYYSSDNLGIKHSRAKRYFDRIKYYTIDEIMTMIKLPNMGYSYWRQLQDKICADGHYCRRGTERSRRNEDQ